MMRKKEVENIEKRSGESQKAKDQKNLMPKLSSPRVNNNNPEDSSRKEKVL